MFAMQYNIALSDEYDMQIIRNRVQDNGEKTDGFPDLFCKLYLIATIQESKNHNNEYCPLYLWKQETGMNRFLYQGFYDNILTSFGWQSIHLMIPYQIEQKQPIVNASYALKKTYVGSPAPHMSAPSFSLAIKDDLARILLYDPTSWTYHEYYLFDSRPLQPQDTVLYEVLHVSPEV